MLKLLFRSTNLTVSIKNLILPCVFHTSFDLWSLGYGHSERNVVIYRAVWSSYIYKYIELVFSRSAERAHLKIGVKLE